MALPHTFVRAQLNPTRSLYWISSSVGHAVADAVITPHSFVAIRMGDRGTPTGNSRDVLLVVSSEKPPSNSAGYVPIFPHTDGPRSPIRTIPPLPHDGPKLYIHTGNWLYLAPSEHKRDDLPTSFAIDAADFTRLHDYALADYIQYHPDRKSQQRTRKIAKAGSGGDEQVGSEWSSFSADEPTEGLNRAVKLYYDLSSLSTMPADLTGALNIYNELELLRRIGNDYSWVGVSDTIKHIKELKPDPVPFSEVPSPQPDFKPTPHAIALRSMPIPFDGEPLQLESDPQADLEIWDDDEWRPSFNRSPGELPTVVPKDLRVIWFEVHGTTWDRETAIKEALQPTLDRDPTLRTKDEGLSLYLECEARSSHHSTSSERILAALQDFGETIGVDTHNQQQAFLSELMGFRTWPDVSRALEALRQKGFRLVASSNVSPSLLGSNMEAPFDQVFGSDCAFHEVLPGSLFKQVLGYCRDEYAADPSQILLVTSNAYRGVEPASAFGVPTAHLRRSGYLEGSENATALVLTKPTYVVHDLLGLCHQLGIDD